MAYLPVFAQSSSDGWGLLVHASDQWRYFPGTAEPPSNWKNAAFNDDLWLQGPGGFGYGDNDDGTVITPVISVFLRIRFNLTDMQYINRILLLADYDDAYVAYLNGTEFARQGISGHPPSFSQFADAQHEALMYQGLYPEETIVGKNQLSELILEGENILAIQVHNADVNSSDLSSNFYLLADYGSHLHDLRVPDTWFKPPVTQESSNLPIVKIDTRGRSIPDEPKIPATIGMIYNGTGQRNYVNDPFNDYEGPIAIEIRGSSSQMFPKKQYGFELRTKTNQMTDTTASLLGLPEEEDWILYAPYSDKSLIRNVLTYKLGSDLGWYAPRTVLVELFLNDQYQGVYVLTEKIKRDKFRVNISKLDPDENSGDDLTGGYIVKIDKLDGASIGRGWDSPYRPPNSTPQTQPIHFQYHYPDENEISTQQETYIRNFVTGFENALSGPEWKHNRFGYRGFINTASFIDYAIMNELTRNVDGYRLSAFFYKDKDSEDGRLYAGPLWDFNLAFGNADYCDGSRISGWAWDFNKVCGGDYWMIPFWWQRFLQDPQYVQEMKSRWFELRQNTLSNNTIFSYIDSLATALDEAQKRNFQRWPVLGTYVWPNNYVGSTYTAEIQYLKNWIGDRLNWLDNSFSAMQIITGLEPQQVAKGISVFPNPSDGKVNLLFDEATYSECQIYVINQIGEIVINNTLITNALIPDNKSIFELNSDLQQGVYLLRIQTESGQTYTTKLVIQ